MVLYRNLGHVIGTAGRSVDERMTGWEGGRRNKKAGRESPVGDRVEEGGRSGMAGRRGKAA